MDRHTGLQDITEKMLKTALNTIQLINKSVSPAMIHTFASAFS